ncbi:glycosyltransferase family 2 protein [bacterium]|nr:glycosyltransferase family 2 protein [candidate division CSSED10-310 bacterium]
MRGNKKISVVIPCYNEEGGIARVIPALPEFIDEIIVVDNNSSDRTAEVARNLGARVILERKQGYGCAYKAGLPAAEGDIIVTMDGDGTYPAHAISYLLDTLLFDNLDFVSAARIPVQWIHSSNMIKRYVGNVVLSIVTCILFGIHLRDSQSGMWVFRRPVLEKIQVISDGMPFSEEFKIRAFKHPEIAAREVPVQFKYITRVGESKLNLWGDGFRNLKYLFSLRREV